MVSNLVKHLGQRPGHEGKGDDGTSGKEKIRTKSDQNQSNPVSHV